MKKLITTFSALIIVLLSGNAFAETPEQVYGWQLMTQEERQEHRMKMQSFKTDAEREQYRLEHHKRMQERAHERGVTLPDVPMQRGKGMGMGGGNGPRQGMGMGGGKGK